MPFRKTYYLGLNAKSCIELKNKVDDFKHQLDKCIYDEYLSNCLEWIRLQSIKYLEVDDTFEPSQVSDIRDNIMKLKFQTRGRTRFVYELIYNSEIVGWVEFGTGKYGAVLKHPMADKLGYHYASGEYSKEGKWTWINEDYDMKRGVTFYGYEGKRFIYRAFQDFINYKIYENYIGTHVIALLNRCF